MTALTRSRTEPTAGLIAHPRSRSMAGLLLLISGSAVLLGIVTAEVLYPAGYNAHRNTVSDLGAMRPENIVRQPSAAIFNTTMIIAAALIAVAAVLLYRSRAGLGRHTLGAECRDARRRAFPPRPVQIDESDHDRRPARGGLAVAGAGRVRAGRLLQPRPARQPRPPECDHDRARIPAPRGRSVGVADVSLGDTHRSDGVPGAVLRRRSLAAVGEAGQQLGLAADPRRAPRHAAGTRIHVVYQWKKHPLGALSGCVLMEFGDFAMLRAIKQRAEAVDRASRSFAAQT
ncbi:MAG: hypothetical protein JWO98_1181 [Frankiales bacterium]|nr:hypothetical protein [Frankiales bacterium]